MVLPAVSEHCTRVWMTKHSTFGVVDSHASFTMAAHLLHQPFPDNFRGLLLQRLVTRVHPTCACVHAMDTQMTKQDATKGFTISAPATHTHTNCQVEPALTVKLGSAGGTKPQTASALIPSHCTPTTHHARQHTQTLCALTHRTPTKNHVIHFPVLAAVGTHRVNLERPAIATAAGSYYVCCHTCVGCISASMQRPWRAKQACACHRSTA